MLTLLLAHIDTSTPPSPRLQRRTRTRPPRRHTSRSESHATTYTSPESSLDVTQSLTAATLGHRRSSAAQEAQMKKTKSLDHQLSSEANNYESIEQVDFDSRETLGVQDSIRSADTSNGHMSVHMTGHVTDHVTDHVMLRKDSYNQAMLAEQGLLHLQQERVGSDDGGADRMGDVDPEMGMRRYKHDTELLPVCKNIEEE